MKETKEGGGGEEAGHDQDHVETTTVSAIMRRRAIYDDGALAAIKIDVEGAELKALQGALPYLRNLKRKKTLLPEITCEIGPLSRWLTQGQTAEDGIGVLQALTGMGYRLFLLHDPWSDFNSVSVLSAIDNKQWTKKWIMKSIGHVLEIEKNFEDKLVNEVFSQKNDFNIWLSFRDLKEDELHVAMRL